MSRSHRSHPNATVAATALLAGLLSGCGGESPPPLPPPTVAPASASAVAPPAPANPLGPRPEVAGPPPFVPPTPAVFTAASGINVWLLERHDVPLVACNLDVPSGASSDPKGKAGLAYATANMLDEGAGKRGALDLARAIDDLGAHLDTSTDADSSSVSISVLKRNLDKAFALFGDVVARPRFEPSEWKRVSELWANELKERDKDPNATARVVYRVTLFGADHPYGHPWDGTLQSAKAVTLDDVRAFYQTAYRPDRATLVCVGRRHEGRAHAAHGLARSDVEGPPASRRPAGRPCRPHGPWPEARARRPPQRPAVGRRGAQARARRVGSGRSRAVAREQRIGGSFSSRLNQDLREKQGYTYGARSRYSVSRGAGQVVAGPTS